MLNPETPIEEVVQPRELAGCGICGQIAEAGTEVKVFESFCYHWFHNSSTGCSL